MKVLLGFFLGFIVPGACAYGIYLDFGSISAAILAWMNTSLLLLMLGNVYNKIEEIRKILWRVK